ncbi:MAG: endonuclease/exonuclease/phosphatase family protein [Prevotellaceae bacterium]|jgi:hypothetical protein|nr:endonuclease/exonuclease/phosphatase family protein [Prevotellaceae bacterium]
MKTRYFLASLYLVSVLSISAQENNLKAYVVGFYNLENLFDTIDSPDVNDEEYTPVNGWGTMKYTNKLERMSYAISKMPEELAILGVSEIENRQVLEDLAAQPAIKERNLKVVHYDSPDLRGVDVGLFYDPAVFTVTNTASYRIRTTIPDFISRDQLVVTGRLAGEEIHVIVLHWPSRGGGENRSNPRRRDAALTTRAIVDSLFSADTNAKIIVMGDLNDDPVNASVVIHLGAKNEKSDMKPQHLYNPCYILYKKGIGSLGYNDQWNLFDQVMVSYELLPKTKGDFATLKYVKSEIFNKDFLKASSGKYKGYPLRTHAGGVWLNGYSDHFPSLIWLLKEE